MTNINITEKEKLMRTFTLILLNILSLTVVLLAIQNYSLRCALSQHDSISENVPESNDLLQELTTK